MLLIEHRLFFLPTPNRPLCVNDYAISVSTKQQRRVSPFNLGGMQSKPYFDERPRTTTTTTTMSPHRGTPPYLGRVRSAQATRVFFLFWTMRFRWRTRRERIYGLGGFSVSRDYILAVRDEDWAPRRSALSSKDSVSLGSQWIRLIPGLLPSPGLREGSAARVRPFPRSPPPSRPPSTPQLDDYSDLMLLHRRTRQWTGSDRGSTSQTWRPRPSAGQLFLGPLRWLVFLDVEPDEPHSV
ncbi:hypothetical protein CPB85DRAFT_1434183 [Mucidula mucida]|nr:hypothetical protein CPB85DRAFT_1434183 [Mucidula mucida]